MIILNEITAKCLQAVSSQQNFCVFKRPVRCPYFPLFIPYHQQRLREIHNHETLLETVLDRNQAVHDSYPVDQVKKDDQNHDENLTTLPATQCDKELRERYQKALHIIQSRLELHEHRLELYELFDGAVASIKQNLMVHSDRLHQLTYQATTFRDRLFWEYDPNVKQYHFISETTSSPAVETSDLPKRSDQFLTQLNNELSAFSDDVDKWNTSSQTQLAKRIDDLRSECLEPESLCRIAQDLSDSIREKLKEPIEQLQRRLNSLYQVCAALSDPFRSVHAYLDACRTELDACSLCAKWPVSIADGQESFSSRSHETKLPATKSEKEYRLTRAQELLDKLNGTKCTKLFEAIDTVRDEFVNAVSQLDVYTLSTHRVEQPLDACIGQLRSTHSQLKTLTHSAVQYWKSSLDEHLQLESMVAAGADELERIENALTHKILDLKAIIPYPSVTDELQSSTTEVPFDLCWSNGDIIYTRILTWLSDDISTQLDHFQTATCHNLTRQLRIVSNSTNADGMAVISLEVSRLHSRADKCSTQRCEYQTRLEEALSKHLQVQEEREKIRNWLDDVQQKFDRWVTRPPQPFSVMSDVDNADAYLATWNVRRTEHEHRLEQLKVSLPSVVILKFEPA